MNHKVKDLIKQLSALDPDAPILIGVASEEFRAASHLWTPSKAVARDGHVVIGLWEEFGSEADLKDRAFKKEKDHGR